MNEIIQTQTTSDPFKFLNYKNTTVKKTRIIYSKYIKSNRWKSIRLKILDRDNFKCKDCGNYASEVHHFNYNFLGEEKESECCISLCKDCHKKRHETYGKTNIIRCSKCKKMRELFPYIWTIMNDFC